MSTRYENTELVFAILSVAGATAACAAHGDVATVEMLASYYSFVADTVHRAGGRMIKVFGDGVIVAFPVSSARAAIEDYVLSGKMAQTCGGSSISAAAYK
ncbi:MAG: Adenylate and Guanylate cyclase catalytic domain [Thermoanaerobaculia bacterium]|nr:Adenylate and Guanylate cyclase catalytic domain [Thermoanaerobaculia bacterium]